jgi:hypothetical protein
MTKLDNNKTIKDPEKLDFNHQYNFGQWNQVIFSCFQKTKKDGTTTSLDTSDLFLISWLYNLYTNTPKEKRKVIGDKDYIYLDNETIQRQLFSLKLKSKSIDKKIRKIRGFKLFDFYHDAGPRKSYVRPNDVILPLMHFSNNKTKEDTAMNLVKLHQYLAYGDNPAINILHPFFSSSCSLKCTAAETQVNSCGDSKGALYINILISNSYNIDIINNYINIVISKLLKNNLGNNFPIPFLASPSGRYKKEIKPKKPEPKKLFALNTPPLKQIEKPLLLTRREYKQLKYIKHWNQLAEEQKNKKYKKRMQIHTLPVDIMDSTTKTIKNICKMLNDLQEGTFTDQRHIKGKADKTIKNFPAQTEIEIKRVIFDYAKLFTSGYSYTDNAIDHNSLMTSMLMFLYNYRAHNSYYITIQKNKVRLIEDSIIENVDIPEAVLKKYQKDVFSSSYWKMKKSHIIKKIINLKLFYNKMHKQASIVYKLNPDYASFKTFERFAISHAIFLKTVYGKMKDVNYGFLNTHGVVWERYKTYCVEKYKVRVQGSYDEKQCRAIQKHWKSKAIEYNRYTYSDFIGIHLIKDLTTEKQKYYLEQEAKKRKLKLSYLDNLKVSQELKDYIINNYETIGYDNTDDFNVVPSCMDMIAEIQAANKR